MKSVKGPSSSRRPRVHVVGGGFSGLMAAYFLSKTGAEVRVSEGHGWGGLLRSEQTEWGLVEAAANGFLLTDLLAKVAKDIEVPLLKTKPQARTRWIVRDQPDKRILTLSQMFVGATRFLGRRCLGLHRPRPCETLSTYTERVLGRTIANRAVLPAVQGIYGYDSRRLSAKLVVDPLLRRGRPKRRGLVSPAEGMGQWIEGLRLQLKSAGVSLIEEQLSEIPDADQVILAGSYSSKGTLLEKSHPLTAKSFRSMQSVPLVSVTSFWQASPRDLTGFGLLFHPDFGWPRSGVLLNDQIFENRSSVKSERWFFPQSSLLTVTDQELLSLIQAQREKLGWKNTFLGMRVHRWPAALPWYSVEHEALLSAISGLPEHVSLLGNEMGEIGLTSLAERAFGLAQKVELSR